MKKENKIPTASELFYNMLEENEGATSTEMMIAFAKLHCEQMLENIIDSTWKGNFNTQGYTICNIDKIKNAYPLTNIK